MKKTLTTVVAAVLLSTVSVAQDGGQKEKQNAAKTKSESVDHKQGQESKNLHPTWKPGAGTGGIKPRIQIDPQTSNPDVKPAREGEKK